MSAYHDTTPLAVRMERRRALGRPVNGSTSYVRADTGQRVVEATERVDPILLLKAYRRGALSTGWSAQEYGRILQTVVSPVCLPEAMQAPARFRLERSA